MRRSFRIDQASILPIDLHNMSCEASSVDAGKKGNWRLPPDPRLNVKMHAASNDADYIYRGTCQDTGELSILLSKLSLSIHGKVGISIEKIARELSKAQE